MWLGEDYDARPEAHRGAGSVGSERMLSAETRSAPDRYARKRTTSCDEHASAKRSVSAHQKCTRTGDSIKLASPVKRHLRDDSCNAHSATVCPRRPLPTEGCPMTYRPEMAVFWALYAVVSMMIFATAWIVADDMRDAWQIALWRLGRGHGAVFLESVGLWRWGVKLSDPAAFGIAVRDRASLARRGPRSRR